MAETISQRSARRAIKNLWGLPGQDALGKLSTHLEGLHQSDPDAAGYISFLLRANRRSLFDDNDRLAFGAGLVTYREARRVHDRAPRVRPIGPQADHVYQHGWTVFLERTSPGIIQQIGTMMMNELTSGELEGLRTLQTQTNLSGFAELVLGKYNDRILDDSPFSEQNRALREWFEASAREADVEVLGLFTVEQMDLFTEMARAADQRQIFQHAGGQLGLGAACLYLIERGQQP